MLCNLLQMLLIHRTVQPLKTNMANIFYGRKRYHVLIFLKEKLNARFAAYYLEIKLLSV